MYWTVLWTVPFTVCLLIYDSFTTTGLSWNNLFGWKRRSKKKRSDLSESETNSLSNSTFWRKSHLRSKTSLRGTTLTLWLRRLLPQTSLHKSITPTILSFFPPFWNFQTELVYTSLTFTSYYIPHVYPMYLSVWN